MEPNAPPFEERIDSVKWALQSGHKVSISCEPLLDVDCGIVEALLHDPELQGISEIWVGAMNGVRNTPILQYENTYWRYKDNPKIKFKESFRKHLQGDLQ